MFPPLDLDNRFQVITVSIIFAIILGIFTVVMFLIVNQGSYSAIYISPDSIIHNPEDNTVLYTYGVKSSETGIMNYTLETYVNATLIKSKQFSLKKGEVLEERDMILLQPEAYYPLKISLKLTTKTANEEVHFWINQQ